MRAKTIAQSGLLTAMGILIPFLFAPYAIRIEPYASYTIASHVPIMVAMFLSPTIAVFVALGTALGFGLTLPPIIAARALSHVIFAYVGAKYIQNHQHLLDNKKKTFVFNCLIALLHASAEMVVVTPFLMSSSTFSWNTFFLTVGVFVGIGGVIHSFIDFTIASIIVKRLPKI